MKRRRLLLALIIGTAVASPRVAFAQSLRQIPRVGYLAPGTADQKLVALYRNSFLDRMRELGYIEGQSFVLEARYWGDDARAAVALVDDLVRARVDIIVTPGTIVTVRAAQAAAGTIPLVMTAATDPVANGFVASLAHPGGNITGLATFSPELLDKRLQLLKEAMPQAARIGFLMNPDEPEHPLRYAALAPTARTLGMTLRAFEARKMDDVDGALAAMTLWTANAFLVMDDPLFYANRDRVSAAAAQSHLALVAGFPEMPSVGCLLTYAPSLRQNWRRAADYVDNIFKGTKAADLPIELPTKFELVINLRTAKALGLTIPPSLLTVADEVIE